MAAVIGWAKFILIAIVVLILGWYFVQNAEAVANVFVTIGRAVVLFFTTIIEGTTGAL